MKKILAAVLLICLAACGPGQALDPAPRWGNDQCLRAELFKSCMASVPKGPDITYENPWHKVIDSCAAAAYSQSWRELKNVSPNCK